MENNVGIDPHQYLPMVKSIVDRLDVNVPSYWDKDDILGYGILGLMEAIGRFQFDKGVQFATFASKRVKGAIIDAIRKDSPLSRNCWQKVQIITDAMERISAITGKEASIEEITREVGMDRAEIEAALQSFKLMASISLEQTLGFDDLTVMDTLQAPKEKSPEAIILKEEQTRCLSKAIEALEYRQRMVLTLYYYEEMNLKEIAATLDISISRVSQLKTMALATLRKQLEADNKV
ncbi:MAG: FliA/WhiG family RNA polymerase sigma factor [Syntrophomonadaceae bacterium]|nr:FliA/WhiG family RNA polymerase sigma factor [Syntrophomonadaceae bacterium]